MDGSSAATAEATDIRIKTEMAIIVDLISERYFW
jgi:hypothetical protein